MNPTRAPDATSDMIAPPAKSFTRHLPTIARLLIGLAFLVFGLNGFLNFIPPPKAPVPDAAMAFVAALVKTGYMIPLIKGTEVFVSMLLLSNRFVPLALVLLAPVLVNILAFHAFLAPSGVIGAVVFIGLELYLAWSYRDAYKLLLTARVSPTR